MRGVDPAVGSAPADAAAVEVIYSFSRAVESNDVFLAALDGALEEQQLTTVNHAIALLKA